MGQLCFLQETKIADEFRIPYLMKGVEMASQQDSRGCVDVCCVTFGTVRVQATV